MRSFSSPRLSISVILFVLLTIAGGACMAEVDAFNDGALRGVKRITIKVEGILDKFARYGLAAEKLREDSARRLTEYGLEIVDGAVAQSDVAASQLGIKLYANEDSFAFYSYKISLKLKRKIPLDREGQAFVAEAVWSKGQSGVLNPSDLPRIYDYVSAMLEDLIVEHGRDNAGSQALLAP